MIDIDDSLLAVNVRNIPESDEDTPNFYAGAAEAEDNTTDWSFKPEKGGCAPYEELIPERKAELIVIYTAMYPERHV